jgi:hypothetical protein
VVRGLPSAICRSIAFVSFAAALIYTNVHTPLHRCLLRRITCAVATQFSYQLRSLRAS